MTSECPQTFCDKNVFVFSTINLQGYPVLSTMKYVSPILNLMSSHPLCDVNINF